MSRKASPRPLLGRLTNEKKKCLQSVLISASLPSRSARYYVLCKLGRPDKQQTKTIKIMTTKQATMTSKRADGLCAVIPAQLVADGHSMSFVPLSCPGEKTCLNVYFYGPDYSRVSRVCALILLQVGGVGNVSRSGNFGYWATIKLPAGARLALEG